ncbi:ABC transporter ATP-binding protein [Ruegeria marina]|uniref:ATP-binding cassette, subfamily B n=1 Tax=Ruegeria marina TaxID=639004 RepID=A0A1G6I5I9_9RHOB|nr:ABC transporter ATP-binding protein [Ruegeria marina]SDC01792.1 ATP-binding cassette, subfamily B [Ruegeria marina]
MSQTTDILGPGPERPLAPRSSGGLAARAGQALFGASPAGWLMPILRPYSARLSLLLLLGLIAACIGLVPPYLSKLVIDQGLMAGNIDALVFWSGTLFAVGLFAVGFGALNNILHMRASVRMLADLRRTLLDALIARPPQWYGAQRAGELLARIDGDAGEVQQFAFNSVLGGLSSIVRLIGGTAMLLVLNWKLGLAAAVLAPIELAFLIWARPRTERLAGTARSARGRLTAGLSETLHGMPALQLARGTDWARGRTVMDQGALNERLMIQQGWTEFIRAVPQVLSALLRAGIFIAGGIMVIQGHWPLGSLIAFVAYMGFMIGPMQSLLGIWHAQARARVALRRLDALMTTGPCQTDSVAAACPDAFDLRLEGVSFGPDRTHPFGPVDADIRHGTKLLLTGPSGAGKTSLLMLVLGQQRPISGRVLVGGVDVGSLAKNTSAGIFAMVSQRPIIVQATLRENLFLDDSLVNSPDADDKVWAMLDALDLGDRFRSAEGLDTVLGENGLTLSGGERQRICLARALLSPFHILVLDEALSEVDTARVSAIMAFIDREFAGLTRIVTTHASVESYGAFDQVLELSGAARCR